MKFTLTNYSNKHFTLITEDNFAYILFFKGEDIGNFILNKDHINNFFTIKDVFIQKKFRGTGLWKQILSIVLNNSKEKLSAKGLLSIGSLRRPASERVWKSITTATVKISNRKKDYYLTHL